MPVTPTFLGPPIQSNQGNQGFSWRQPTRRFPMPQVGQQFDPAMGSGNALPGIDPNQQGSVGFGWRSPGSPGAGTSGGLMTGGSQQGQVGGNDQQQGNQVGDLTGGQPPPIVPPAVLPMGDAGGPPSYGTPMTQAQFSAKYPQFHIPSGFQWPTPGVQPPTPWHL